VLFIGPGRTDSYPNWDRTCRLNDIAWRGKNRGEQIEFGSVSSGQEGVSLGSKAAVSGARGGRVWAREKSVQRRGGVGLRHRSHARERTKGMTGGAGLSVRRRGRKRARAGWLTCVHADGWAGCRKRKFPEREGERKGKLPERVSFLFFF